MAKQTVKETITNEVDLARTFLSEARFQESHDHLLVAARKLEHFALAEHVAGPEVHILMRADLSETDPIIGLFTDYEEAERTREVFERSGLEVILLDQTETVDIMTAAEWRRELADDIADEEQGS